MSIFVDFPLHHPGVMHTCKVAESVKRSGRKQMIPIHPQFTSTFDILPGENIVSVKFNQNYSEAPKKAQGKRRFLAEPFPSQGKRRFFPSGKAAKAAKTLKSTNGDAKASKGVLKEQNARASKGFPKDEPSVKPRIVSW